MIMIDQTIYLFILSLGISFFMGLITLITFCWHKKYTDDNLARIHKSHDVATPRIGGLSVLLSMLVGLLASPPDFRGLFLPIFLAALPVFVFGFTEDLFGVVSAKLRLFVAISSGAVGWFVTGVGIHAIGIPFIDHVLSFPLLTFIFTAFAVGGMINAFNVIDGVNGASMGVAILALLGIATISSFVGDSAVLCFSSICLGAIFGLFIFNYPSGLIFLGDAGAYLIGFIVSWLSILLLSRHPEINIYAPMLLCIHPFIETVYSMYRRRKSGHLLTDPDIFHLHSLINRAYLKIKLPGYNTLYKNSITGTFILLMNIPGFFVSILFWNNQWVLVSYILFYWMIYKKLYTHLQTNYLYFQH
jgi:UDP-N-acetylmuramyl pentapeptide phosphotransferase/UDP-N-acetylglucosamine-1-phosphate transferase